MAKKLKKYDIINQAVAKKPTFERQRLPSQFQPILRLERVFVSGSKYQIFKKGTIMPKGKYHKLIGSIGNILISEIDRKCF